MGVAKFIAVDTFQPEMTSSELENMLGKMDGILDWAINPDDNEVAVEYNHELINDEMIEAALKGVGLRLKHICDDPDIPLREGMEILNREVAQDQEGLHD